LPPACGETPAGQDILFFPLIPADDARSLAFAAMLSPATTLLPARGWDFREEKTRPRNNSEAYGSGRGSFPHCQRLVQVEPLRGRHD
jgi:hypothetical protein